MGKRTFHNLDLGGRSMVELVEVFAMAGKLSVGLEGPVDELSHFLEQFDGTLE